MAGKDEDGSGSEAEGDADGGKVQCALVEHVRGIRSRKWTMELGEVYHVGRNGTGAQIEIDHPSMSRRQCSLAITRDPAGSGLVLVALDNGSTNGTFVNKDRLKHGVGLTKALSEIKYLAFGECQNGYRIMVSQGPAAPRERSRSPKAQREAEETAQPGHVLCWEDKAAKALQMKGAAKDAAKRKAQPAQEVQRAPPKAKAFVQNRQARRAAAKAEGGGETVAGKPKASDIEWPEDWR